MLNSYRRPYNLKNFKRDLKESRDLTLSASLSPHQQKNPTHVFNLKEPKEEDKHFYPESTFHHLGLNSSRLYFYDEVVAANFHQLKSEELKLKIENFLQPYQELLTNGEFFFHGSALVSLIYEFIFQKPLGYENINIIAKINSLSHPLHPVYYKFPRPLSDDFITEKWAHVGSEDRSGISFDYVMSLDGEKLNMINFFSKQAFNFSQVYFDYQSKTLHWGEGFLEFLDSFTIRLKPENFNIDAFLHALRLSKTWDSVFYPNDYYPLFVKKFDRLPQNHGRIQTSLHFSLEGMSVYNLDSIKPMLGKIQNKKLLSL